MAGLKGELYIASFVFSVIFELKSGCVNCELEGKPGTFTIAIKISCIYTALLSSILTCI